MWTPKKQGPDRGVGQVLSRGCGPREEEQGQREETRRQEHEMTGLAMEMVAAPFPQAFVLRGPRKKVSSAAHS